MDHAAIGHGATGVGRDLSAAGAGPRADMHAEMHMRMLADPAIRRRLLADTAMRRTMTDMTRTMPAEQRARMEAMLRDPATAPAAARPARRATPRPAARAAPELHCGSRAPGRAPRAHRARR